MDRCSAPQTSIQRSGLRIPSETQLRSGHRNRSADFCRLAEDPFLLSNPSAIPVPDHATPTVPKKNSNTHVDGNGTSPGEHHHELDFLRSATETVGDAIVVLGSDLRIISLNPAAEGLTGWTLTEAHGEFLFDLIPVLDADDREVDLESCSRKGRRLVLDRLTSLEHRDGQRIAVEGLATPVHAGSGQSLVGAVIVLRDISDRERLAQRLARASSYDTLTGLLNREGFDLHVQKSLEKVQHDPDGEDPGTGASAADSERGSGDVLCHIDLDQFQVVNDTCGHAAGDMLVQWTASLIRERLRDADVLGRLGGDEFGLLLRDTTLQDAMCLADEIHSALAVFRFVWQDASFHVGMSLGMVAVTSEFETPANLSGAADRACFLAKQQGRGRTQLYRRDADEVRRHQGQMNWVVRLRQALDEDLFELHWQRIAPIRPVVADGQLFFEVLLRMRSREGEIHLPGEFLPAAERFGLMAEIDCWVMRHLPPLLTQQSADFLEQLGCCTVNLSGASVGNPDVLAEIQHQLDQSGFPGEKLCFEITETAAVTNLERALHMIETLRRRRCKWALDDFGSGMSSYRYLQKLPVDFVKIDGNIIADVVHSPLSRAVVQSIHQIAHVMDARTIAEFVETEELLNILDEIGLDFAQGYHIHRPQLIRDREEAADYLSLES